jgi:hypothetical protein
MQHHFMCAATMVAVVASASVSADELKHDTPGSTTAMGMLLADIDNEKCTGEQPAENQAQREAAAMMAIGIREDEVRRGFAQAFFRSMSEGQPTASECRRAAKLHRLNLQRIARF